MKIAAPFIFIAVFMLTFYFAMTRFGEWNDDPETCEVIFLYLTVWLLALAGILTIASIKGGLK